MLREISRLAVGPLAAAAGRPILFTLRDTVPSATRAFLRDNPVDSAIVLGGKAVVSDKVAGELGAADRLAGANRYATAAVIATYGMDDLGMNRRIVGITTGLDFADGLASAPVFGGRRRVLLLTSPSALSSPALGFLKANEASLARIIAIGGTGAISESTFQSALKAID